VNYEEKLIELMKDFDISDHVSKIIIKEAEELGDIEIVKNIVTKLNEYLRNK
jgi:polysaccharide pyruvyl transferase WcaK-like protein